MRSEHAGLVLTARHIHNTRLCEAHDGPTSNCISSDHNPGWNHKAHPAAVRNLQQRGCGSSTPALAPAGLRRKRHSLPCRPRTPPPKSATHGLLTKLALSHCIVEGR